MEREFINALMNCNTNSQVSQVIADNKELLKADPGLWNHVFRTRNRIRVIDSEKRKTFAELLN